MEWTKSETLKFIKLWHSFPCLWNKTFNDYKNRQKRREALEQIAQETNTSAITVEKKILSLKTQYNREINKLKLKLGTDHDEKPISSWYAFEHMHFIKDTSTPRCTTDSFMIILTQNEEEEVTVSPDSINQANNSTIREQCTTQQARNNKRKLNSQPGSLDLLNDTSNAIMNKQKKDEFLIFGETVASELREIKSKRHILVLKKKIMDLIYETKLNILDTD